jgi:hypothetical protein
MAAVVNVGLAVTAHNNSALNESTFTDVSLTGPNVNNPPVAVNDILLHFPDMPVKVRDSDLLQNDTDADGGALTLQSVVTPSAAGGSVTRAGGWVRYVPPPGLAGNDTFTYVVGDNQGATAVGSVVVQIQSNQAATPNLRMEDLGNGSIQLRFQGIPGRVYGLEYSVNQPNPSWIVLGSAVAGATGTVTYLDTPPVGSPPRIYRTRNP